MDQAKLLKNSHNICSAIDEGSHFKGFLANKPSTRKKEQAVDSRTQGHPTKNCYGLKRKRSLGEVEIGSEKQKRPILKEGESHVMNLEGNDSGWTGDEEMELTFRDNLLDQLEDSNHRDNKDDNKQGVPDVADGKDNIPFLQDRKIIIMKGQLPSLALPEGWLALNHRSGGIIYLHRPTRVCTWSRPYHIGIGSVRKHDVPIAAIPCLQQKRTLIKEALKTPNSQPLNSTGTVLNYLNTVGTALEEEAAFPLNKNGMERKGVVSLEEGGDDKVSTLNSERCRDGLLLSPVVDCTVRNFDVTHDVDDAGDNGVCLRDGLDVINANVVEDEGSPCSTEENKDETSGISVEHMRMCCEDSNEAKCNFNHSTKTVQSSAVGLADSKEISSQSSSLSLASDNSLLDIPTCKTKSHVNEDDNDETSVYSLEQNNTDWLAEDNESSKASDVSKSTSQENDLNFTSATNLKNSYSKDKELPSSTYTKSGIEFIDTDDLSSYLANLYEFQHLTHEQEQNVTVTAPQESYPGEADLPPVLQSLPYSVKGIDVLSKQQNKEWVINPGGKTPVAILHEYSQRVIKEKPEYVCSECDSASTPFMAEVRINGITYGMGVAASKKQARQVAAEATLEVFLPGVFQKIRDYEICREELEFFEKIKVDDPKVYEVSIKTGLPSPSQVLQECLKRNQGVCSSTINFKMIPGPNQKHKYKISCGKHMAEGVCKNKKIGKQLASQAILKKLHPHIHSWGSLLRIYCDRPSTVVKKCKAEDELLTRPHAVSSDVPRGQLLLDRLKEEMRTIASQEKDKDLQDAPATTSSLGFVQKNNPIVTMDI